MLNHSQRFREQPVKIPVPYYKYLLRKSALHKHYFNIDMIELPETLNFFNDLSFVTGTTYGYDLLPHFIPSF